MPRDLSVFFSPNSIAVVGASRSPEKVGSIILRNIIDSGFKGKIYPVNPQADFINDLKCYPDVPALPNDIDLALIAVPAEISLEVINRLGLKGIKNVVLFASGFKEVGAEGLVLESKLDKLVKKYDLNLLGPNCLGFVNNIAKINATFGELVKNTGNLKFISQSGAIAASIFDWANSIGLGFSEFITLGNKTDLNENHILEYFKKLSEKEGATSNFSIGMYLESISDGQEFMKLTSELSKKHPIFIIKPGKTTAASAAMKSHTGSMAGEDAVLDAALDQCGVLRCDTMEDFFDVTKAFSWLPLPEGTNVAVISNAGGPGVLSADSVILEGLNLVTFEDSIKKKLMQVLPRTSSILNPVDLMGDALAERYGHAAEIIVQNHDVDFLLFLLTPQLMTQIEKTAEYISFVSKKYKKPIVCSFIGGNLVNSGENILNKNKIPVFRFPERAIKVISMMWKYKIKTKNIHKNITIKSESLVLKNRDKISEIIQTAANKKYISLDNIQSDNIVNYLGISTPQTQYVLTYEEALLFSKEVSWPVVLKISASGLLHKKDLGGVITKISDPDTLKTSFESIQKSVKKLKDKKVQNIKIQIQKQVEDGIEIILGLKKDPTFGNFILFGAGGSFVELIEDRNISILNNNYLSTAHAKELIEKSKIYKILKKENISINLLSEVISNFSKLSIFTNNIQDIEINPLIITNDNVWAVDSKVILRSKNA